MISKKQSPGDPNLLQKEAIIKESFIEKELLNASVVQKELMISIRELNTQLWTLNGTINLIREHEFVELHKSKWRIVIYQLCLGIIFAVGTVIGLVLISWASYTFFKDSELLRQIVDKQLSTRNFNFGEIKGRAVKDANGLKTTTVTATGGVKSGDIILVK